MLMMSYRDSPDNAKHAYDIDSISQPLLQWFFALCASEGGFRVRNLPLPFRKENILLNGWCGGANSSIFSHLLELIVKGEDTAVKMINVSLVNVRRLFASHPCRAKKINFWVCRCDWNEFRGYNIRSDGHQKCPLHSVQFSAFQATIETPINQRRHVYAHTFSHNNVCPCVHQPVRSSVNFLSNEILM